MLFETRKRVGQCITKLTSESDDHGYDIIIATLCLKFTYIYTEEALDSTILSMYLAFLRLWIFSPIHSNRGELA